MGLYLCISREVGLKTLQKYLIKELERRWLLRILSKWQGFFLKRFKDII